MLEPIIANDARMLDGGTDAAALRAVRLHRHCRLDVVRPDAAGNLAVVATLGTAWSPSADWVPEKGDVSDKALATLAASYKLRDGERFALKVLAR